MNSAGYPNLARVLLLAAELVLLVTVASVTLLYSPRLADNFLGKAALVHILGGLCALLWATAKVAGGQLTWARSGQWLPFIGLLGVFAVSAWGAENGLVALEDWLLWTQWLVLLFVTADLATDAAVSRRIIAGLLALSIVVSGIALLQVGGLDLVSLPGAHGTAPLSTLGNTNFVAHYIEQVLPLALAVLVFRSWSGKFRWLAAASFGAGGVLLILARSRGGWLGVGAALLIMLSAVPRRPGWGRRLLLAILVAALLSPVVGFVLHSVPASGGRSMAQAATQMADASWQRVMSTFDAASFSRAMRLLIWRDTLRVAQAQPFLGVGPGHLGFELQAHRTTTGQREWRALMGQRINEPKHAHNEFLESWAECGVLAVVFLVWLLAAGLKLAWHRSRAETGVGAVAEAGCDRSIAVGCLGALVAAVLHALFSFNLRDPVSGTHLWVVCGLLTGCAQRARPARPVWSLAPLRRRGIVVTAGAGLAAAGVFTGLCMLMGDAYFLRSQQHLSAGHGNRAILALQQAVAWRDHEFSYHHWLGHVSLQMKQPEAAATALTRSLELHHNNPGAIRLLATALLSTNAGGRAVAPLRHAIDIDPLVADNYSLLADALRQSGQATAAVTARRQALSLRGEPMLMAALATDLYAAGHLDSATAVLQQASHTWPQQATIVGNLGAMLLQSGDAAAAIDVLRRAVALEPSRAEWHGNLSLALRQQGRIAEALEAVWLALRYQPDNRAWLQLAAQLQSASSEVNSTESVDETADEH